MATRDITQACKDFTLVHGQDGVIRDAKRSCTRDQFRGMIKLRFLTYAKKRREHCKPRPSKAINDHAEWL